MAMRAQLSLQFTDKDLFDNFITPAKERRELNGIIIRCLSRYYYDEAVRNAIEGYSETAEEPVQNSQLSAIFDDIHETLAMQSTMASMLETTISEGAEDMGDLLNRTNSEVVKHQDDEAFREKVSEIPRLGVKSQASGQTGKAGALSGREGLILQAITMLAKATGNMEVLSLFGGSQEEPNTVSEPVAENSSSLSPVTETSSDVVTSSSLSDFDEGGEWKDVPKAPESEPEVEDASDAMLELLNSL